MSIYQMNEEQKELCWRIIEWQRSRLSCHSDEWRKKFDAIMKLARENGYCTQAKDETIRASVGFWRNYVADMISDRLLKHFIFQGDNPDSDFWDVMCILERKNEEQDIYENMIKGDSEFAKFTQVEEAEISAAIYLSAEDFCAHGATYNHINHVNFEKSLPEIVDICKSTIYYQVNYERYKGYFNDFNSEETYKFFLKRLFKRHITRLIASTSIILLPLLQEKLKTDDDTWTKQLFIENPNHLKLEKFDFIF